MNRKAGLAAALMCIGVLWMGALSRYRPQPMVVRAEDEVAVANLAGTPSFTLLPDGTRLNLDTAQPVALPGGGLQVEASLWLEPATTPTEAVVFTLDMSGSALVEGQGCGGDFNADGLSDTVLDCELASTLAAIEEIGSWGTVSEVSLVLFELLAGLPDLQPVAGRQGLTAPLADLNGDGVLDVETVLRSVGNTGFLSIGARQFSTVTIRFGSFGGTNFHAAAQSSCTALAQTSQPKRTIVFLSDGEATSGPAVSTVLPCSAPAVIQTVAVGPGSSCTANGGGRGSLTDIAAYGGGACTQITEPGELAGVLSAAVVPRILSATLTVDGGPPIDVSGSVVPGLPHLGAGTLQLSHPLAEDASELCLTVSAGLPSGEPVQVTECVGTHSSTPPVADAGPDVTVIEGERVVLDGSASSDPDGDSLTYTWELQSLQGPPLLIAGGTGPLATVQTLDDGHYTLQLTVSDGVHTATDTMEVVVTNAAPVATAHGDGAAATGVALVTAQLTDAGVIDTHQATVDWGDGTPLETVPVSAQGTGWASMFASHVYPTAGPRTATVTLTDDDGDSEVVTVELEVDPVVAMWADGTAGNAIDWTGGGGNVTGLVHSNAGLRFNGQEKTVVGGAQYVTTATVGNHVTVDPPPMQVSVATHPIPYDLAAFAPGGEVAVQAGTDFHDMSGSCTAGRWDVSTALAPGLYYAPCAVKLWSPQAEVTLVATGEIDVVSQGTNLRPFVDGLLLASAAAGTAIDLASSGGTWLGHLFAPNGTIDLSGSNNTVLCGMLAREIDLSGSGLELHASDCVRPQQTNAPPVLVPLLEVALAQSPVTAIPGEPVTATLTVSNDQARLLVPGIIGLENHGTTPVTVTSATVMLEALEVSTGSWTAVSTALLTRANAAPGVSYAAGPVGTVIDGGALASWGAELQATLPAQTVAWLLDATQVAAIRTAVDFEVDDASAPVRSLYRFGDDLAPALRPQGTVTDVALTLTTFDGTTRLLDADDASALAEVGPGNVVVVTVEVAAPVPAPIGADETAEAYLGRLLALDGRGLGALASGRGTSSLGPALAPQVFATSTLALPILEPQTEVPPSVTAGAVLAVPVDLVATGSADAVAVSGTVATDGASDALALPTALIPGQIAGDTAALVVPEALGGSFADVVTEVAWSDDLGGLYGPIPLREQTFVDLAPVLSALLTGVLAVDNDLNGVLTAGDTVELAATIRNGGSAAVSDVTLVVPLDPSAPLVSGSVTTTAGSVLRADTQIEVAIGTLPGFGTATVRWQAVLGAVSSVTHQGTVSAASLAPVATDDPSVSGTADPTVTRVVPVEPVLEATLAGVLLVDADLDQVPSPGDTVRYIAGVHNPGLSAVEAVQLAVAPGSGVALVVGSVQIEGGGTVLSGNGSGETAVAVNFGTIDGFAAPAAVFDVTVTGVPGTEVLTQGTVTATGLALVTDDPVTPAVGDPTRTQIGGPTTGIPGAPAVELGAPLDGARVGAPVEVTATATPEPGAAVTSWAVTVAAAGDPVGTVLASGTGPLPAVLGTFDPTVLQNGLWKLQMEVTDDLGRTGVSEASLEVAGEMKLGSFDVAFLEAEWHASVTPISLVRSYSTLRKDVVGDFGHGWALGMLDFTVQTNGPLGEGGWTQQGCGSGLVFAPVCTTSTRPHLVLVRWPDGHVEAFDLTPDPGNTFFSPITTVSYTPRPGATSALEPVVGDELIFVANDGNLYTDLSLQEVYEPQRYWLTDQQGHRYLLDVDQGLVETVDRNGNRVQFGPDGIFPDRGSGVSFLRDAQGRIEQMLLPDNSTIDYAYDASGDLVQVIDGEGNVVEFDYDSAHRLVSYNVQGRAPALQATFGPDGRLEQVVDGGVVLQHSSRIDLFEQITVGPDPRLTTTTRFDQDGLAFETVQDFVDEASVAQHLVTSMTYDEDFLLATRTHPSGAVESWAHDDQGRVVAHTDPAGVLREWTYGPFGQIATLHEAGALVEQTEFDDVGMPETTLRGDGSVLRRTTWDEDGLLTSIENGTGQRVVFTYDARGLLDSIELPPFGGSSDVVDVTMDDRGQLVEVTRNYPTGPGTTTYTYDANGNRTSITDPRGRQMTFTYDAFGRMETYTDKLGRTVVWTYDAAGRELTRTNRNGQVLTRTYDAAGRLATMTGPGVDREYHYDALGRPVYSRAGAHVEERFYDGVDLIELQVYGTDTSGHADATLAFAFDPAGRLVELVGPSTALDPGLSVGYGYDARGRLGSVIEAGLGAFTIGYDAAGRPATLQRPNGALTTTTYNDADQVLATSTVDAMGALVHQIATTYDARGLPDSQTDQEGTHTFEHDGVGRLIGVDHPPGAAFADESYTYDAADRRRSSADDPASEVVYDDGDRLLQDADYTYAYDDEGRRVSRTHRGTGEVTLYEYNVLDQLVSLEEGGTTWSFVYDARDLRVLVTASSGGVQTYGEAFVYGLDGTVRASYDTSGAVTASYVTGFGFGEVLARVDAAGLAAYALRARLATTVGWLDAAGAVSGLVHRDAYGVRVPPEGVEPFGFTGHAEDPTGLTWGRVRYLDPRPGGWLSEDPESHQPRYTYALASPTLLVDPTGTAVILEYQLHNKLTGVRLVSLPAGPGALQMLIQQRMLLVARGIQVATVYIVDFSR